MAAGQGRGRLVRILDRWEVKLTVSTMYRNVVVKIWEWIIKKTSSNGKELQRLNTEMSSVSWLRKMLSKEWNTDVMKN